MRSRLTHLTGSELLACAVHGSGSVRRRVEHELDRRAAGALVRRILTEARPPAQPQAETAGPAALLAV